MSTFTREQAETLGYLMHDMFDLFGHGLETNAPLRSGIKKAAEAALKCLEKVEAKLLAAKFQALTKALKEAQSKNVDGKHSTDQEAAKVDTTTKQAQAEIGAAAKLEQDSMKKLEVKHSTADFVGDNMVRSNETKTKQEPAPRSQLALPLSGARIILVLDRKCDNSRKLLGQIDNIYQQCEQVVPTYESQNWDALVRNATLVCPLVITCNNARDFPEDVLPSVVFVGQTDIVVAPEQRLIQRLAGSISNDIVSVVNRMASDEYLVIDRARETYGTYQV